jgi:hypothetical protein
MITLTHNCWIMQLHNPTYASKSYLPVAEQTYQRSYFIARPCMISIWKWKSKWWRCVCASSQDIQWTLYPLFLKGPRKINDECRKTKVAGKLFIWEMYRDQRKWMILAWKQCMREWWIEVSLYLSSCAQLLCTYIFGRDKGITHEIHPTSCCGNIVEWVRSLQCLVDWVVHNSGW